MMRRLRFGAISVAVLIVGILVPAMARPADAGGPTPLVVGVDNAPPAGHDWTYRDFFPRDGITVHDGDVLDFKWNAASPDGFHTTTALKDGESPGDAWSTIYPTFVPDDDDGPGQLALNPAVNFPSDPSCGDSAGTPCAYDGSTDVNSGANGTTGGTD